MTRLINRMLSLSCSSSPSSWEKKKTKNRWAIFLARRVPQSVLCRSRVLVGQCHSPRGLMWSDWQWRPVCQSPSLHGAKKHSWNRPRARWVEKTSLSHRSPFFFFISAVFGKVWTDNHMFKFITADCTERSLTWDVVLPDQKLQMLIRY